MKAIDAKIANICRGVSAKLSAVNEPYLHSRQMTDRKFLAVMMALKRKVLWLAFRTIHDANHVRKKVDEIKVSGHQASAASKVTLMTALYFRILRPEDRIAIIPYASPVFHVIRSLLGQQSREQFEAFRGYSGARSYPSCAKDVGGVDFSIGSVGHDAAMSGHCTLLSVIDGRPAALSWLSGVCGPRIVMPGVERFGETGTIRELYRHHSIDAEFIAMAAATLVPGRSVKPLRVVG